MPFFEKIVNHFLPESGTFYDLLSWFQLNTNVKYWKTKITNSPRTEGTVWHDEDDAEIIMKFSDFFADFVQETSSTTEHMHDDPNLLLTILNPAAYISI